MEKPSKLTTKKVIIILVSIFAICGIALGALVFARNASRVASTEDYGYVNPDETQAETDEGFKIDGVLDEAQYQNNKWLYLHNTEGGADVDIAMTSYYGEKGMYFVYDVTERTPIYVNTDRASYLNSCIEMYLAPSSVTALNGNSVFEIDLLPTGDMTFKKSNGKGGYVNVATTDDKMAVLGATTKGGEVNTEECTGYNLELFIPWDYMDKLGMDVDAMKENYTYVNPAHITSFNFAGTDTAVDRYWYFFAQQHGATFSNVYQYYRFNEDGALGTMPTKKTEGEHVSITGDAAVIPGMKTTYTITPDKGYAVNSILVNGEEYISKVSYDKEGAALLTIRGKVEGLEIAATAEAATDGNKTLSGTISINKMGGDSLAGVSASYNGPTGEKPIEFDAAGSFALTDLKQGYYTITVEKEGYDKLTRGIYLNRDIITELVLEYPTFEVVSGGCWMLDYQNEGILNKFGGAGVILSKDAYSKFTVEANFRFDEELTKEYENNTHFTQQRQGLRIKFSNEKVWHIDVMKENGKYIVQYAKFSGDNTMFGWKGIHEMTASEIAKFTSENGIKLEVQRDGKYANVYLDDKLIAVEVLDDEFAKCTAQIGFESWDAKRTIYEIPYKITNKTDVNLASGIFKMAKEWDLTNQYNGLLKIPNCDGDAGWIGFLKNYANIDLTLNLKDYIGNKTELRHVVKFTFDNKETAAISLTYADNQYKIQSMGDTLFGWRAHYVLTDEQIAKFQSKDGIDLRIVRIGTEMTLYLDGEQVAICDLTKNKKKEASGITADMPAEIAMRHYGNEGHTVEMPFAVKETFDNVTITSVEGAHGKLVTPKQNYIIGDTVKLSGKGKEGYYCIGMKVNGVDVPLNWDGTYTFKATEKAYTVEGTFAKRVFKDSKEWNLLKQNEGVISVPADHDGDSGYVDFYKQYKDIDLTLTTRDYIGNNKKLRTVVKFGFENGETAMFSITYNDDEYKLQAMGDTLYGWGRHHKMTDEQIAKWQSKEGIDFRVVREGTEVLLFLDDVLVKVCDLTSTNKIANTGITADMAATVSIRHYGNVGYASEIPFTVSDTVADVIDGDITLPNGGRVDTLIRNYAEDIDLTLNVKEYADAENKAARNDVLFVFENGAHVSFGITSDENGAWIQSLNNASNDGKQIYNRYKGWGNLTAEEFAQYKDGGIEFRVVRIGTEVSLYIGDRFVAVADLTNNERGVAADTKAKVTVRHYDDAGLKVVIPFEWTEEIELVSITCEESKYGKAVTNKASYFVGDTVIVSGEAENGYYCNGIKVNGEDVELDIDGNYTFKATEKNYTVKASFAESIFKTNQLAYWNIANQNNGFVIHRETITGNSPNLDFAKKYLNAEISITIKAQKDDFNEDGTLKDANGDRTAISYWTSKATVGFGIVLQPDGKYYVGNSANYNGYDNSIYALNEEETKMVTEGDGIRLRVIRIGSEAKIYLEDKYLMTYELPYGEDEAATVFIKRWDDGGVRAEIPFTVSETIPETTAITIADCTNGAVTTDHKNYLLNEDVILKVTPDNGYDCTSLKVNGEKVTISNGTYIFKATEKTYKVEAVFKQRVNITIADTANGKFTVEKTQYYVGEDVVLKEEGDAGYYYSSLKVNNEDVMLGWDGTYTFKATETEYNIKGSFAEKVFKDKAEWDYKDWKVGNQNVGVLGLVGDGDSAGWVTTAADTYKDVTLTLHDYVKNSTDFRAAVQFDFTNGKAFRISLTNADTGDGNGDGVADTGVYKIQGMGNNTIVGDWKSYYYLSDAEVEKLLSTDGIKFRVTLIDKMASIFLDDVKVCDIDLSAGIDADATARVYFRMYGNAGHDVEIPYVVSGEKIPVAVNIQQGIKNGTITADKESYYAGDTVVLTVTGADGFYYNSLKINGEEVTVDSEGKYSFKATELKYVIAGSFAETLFKADTHWDIVNQHKGMIYQKDTVTASSNWLTTSKKYVNSDTSIIIKAGEDDFHADGTLKDTNGDRTAINFDNGKTHYGYSILLENGKYYIGHAGAGKYNNGIHTFTDEETEKIKEEGIELRVVKTGSKMDIYLDGKYIKSETNNGFVGEASVRIKRFDDGGLRVPVQFKFSAELPQAATVHIAETENGTITTVKESYIVGEQVTIKAQGNDGYACNYITVDGTPVELEADGTYTFKATKASYEIAGTFAESRFDDASDWNVQGQYFGAVAVSSCDGDTGWLKSTGNFTEISAIAKDYAGGNSTFAFVENLSFSNGDWISIRLTDIGQENGHYILQSMKDSLYGWTEHYMLDETKDADLIAKLKGEGLEFKLVRHETMVNIVLGGRVVHTLDLTIDQWDEKTEKLITPEESGIEATTTIKDGGFRIYGNSEYDIKIPFTMLNGNVTVSISDIDNGSVITNKVVYYLGDTITLKGTSKEGYV